MRRASEEPFHHYPHAMSMCDCEPTHTWDGVDCVSVRRSAGMDRCMECNERWPAASAVTPQQAMSLVVPCAKFAERGTPCVPGDGSACAQCGNVRAA